MHMEMLHADVQDVQTTVECPVCKRSFKTAPGLKIHRYRTIGCKDINAPIEGGPVQKIARQRVRNATRPKNARLTCRFCKRKLARNQLMKHIRHQHEPRWDRNLMCPICTHRCFFKSWVAFYGHFRGVHSINLSKFSAADREAIKAQSEGKYVQTVKDGRKKTCIEFPEAGDISSLWDRLEKNVPANLVPPRPEVQPQVQLTQVLADGGGQVNENEEIIQTVKLEQQDGDEQN